MRHPSWSAALLVALAVLAACSSLRMVPPPDVEERSDVLEVKGRSGWSGSLVDESFELGPYAVAKVNRGSDSSRSTTWGDARLLAWTKGETTTGYTFQFRDGERAVDAQCSSITGREAFRRGDRAYSTQATRLACLCGSGDDAPRLEFDGRR